MRNFSRGKRLAVPVFLAAGVCWNLLSMHAGTLERASHERFADVTEAMELAIGNGRAAWADLDGDGWADLVVGGRLWRNLEGRRFEEVTETAGFGRYGGAAVIADFDGNGTLDLYLTDRKGTLLLNRGELRFEPAPTAPNPQGKRILILA